MKRSRIRPRSAKREAIAPERRELVTTLLLRYPVCQLPGCRNDSQHVHEKLTRARGGSILDVENCLAICSSCHRQIHDNTTWATEQGLLVSQFPHPSRVLALPDPTPRPGAQSLAGGTDPSGVKEGTGD